MNFEEAVQYLFGLGHEILTMKLGLRNTELLFQSLDNPERSFPAVQIAGTNGKGSTAVMLDSVCRAAGITTGLYTSPHLVSITERIQIAGKQISEDDFARHATTVRDAAQRLLDSGKLEALPTFFEHVTAIALLAFREAGIELAILETGMGGRLDSTTAANASTVAITSIAMDHEQYLGSMIESIASEKAAIIRPGVTAIIGKQDPRALAVLLQRCEATGVQPILATPPSARIRVGLRGKHQLENAAIAIAVAQSLSIPPEAILSGIETASHPGRLELISNEPDILLDGAHNPAGADALRDYLNEFDCRPLTIVFGAMSDKQLDRIGELLFPLADNLILTTIDNPRTASLETLAAIAVRSARGSVTKSKTISDAFQTSLRITPREGLICVTGSLYLIGEWKREHGTAKNHQQPKGF
ncbi:MAG TPA: folylpolyglutamate synthase/dihydrofolate synthase family protein [Pyrinomonadaceae bacterium]|nr:folylpolyglutamate synthase/dihydrofolate synthase family protein [Pyrinomonadaceae bacterium]